MFFHITYARYAYNCSMTQFIVAADELPNAQPNPRLELRMEMEMELGTGYCGCHCCWLPSGQRKCAQSVTLENEMECFNLAQFNA